MGNDIKLPISQRREAQLHLESKNRKQLLAEISKSQEDIGAANHEIAGIEHRIKRCTTNIDYYQKIILELSIKLNHIEMEQLNMSLVRENYAEKAREYANSLNETDQTEAEKDDEVDYSDTAISDLERKRDALSNQVAANEATIEQKWQEISPTNQNL